MNIQKTIANRDEHCEYCGWPFDSGDTCYTDSPDGSVYCTRACVVRDNVEQAKETIAI